MFARCHHEKAHIHDRRHADDSPPTPGRAGTSTFLHTRTSFSSWRRSESAALSQRSTRTATRAIPACSSRERRDDGIVRVARARARAISSARSGRTALRPATGGWRIPAQARTGVPWLPRAAHDRRDDRWPPPRLGGARAGVSVTPDLATYGKLLGGRSPIGTVDGRAGLMDVVTRLGTIGRAAATIARSETSTRAK